MRWIKYFLGNGCLGGDMNGARMLIMIVGVFSLVMQQANAQDLAFQNLDKGKFEKIVGDLSTNFMHTSVQGAAPLGHIFGFEVGVVAGVTKTPEINKIAQETDPEAKADQVPHGELLGVLTVPFGLTGEIGLIPKVGSSDFKFNTMSLAVKWTPSELFFDLPVDLAVKGHFTTVNLEFSQDISGNKVDYEFKNSISGLTFLVSKNFAIVEPYFGLGLVNAKGDLSATGSGTVFDTTYTTGASVSETRSGTAWMLGTEVKLLIFKLGIEYTNMFSTSRYTGKFAFYF